LTGQNDNTTNNREGEIHPCFVMFSGGEMQLFKALKETTPTVKKSSETTEHLNWLGVLRQLARLKSGHFP